MIELNLMPEDEHRAILQKLLEDGNITKKRFDDLLSENPQCSTIARTSRIEELKKEYERVVDMKPLTFLGMIHAWIECKLIRRQTRKLEKLNAKNT